MAANGYGPVTGHAGRIPNYGKTQVNPMGSSEPPACIQNAMMTKDKKPFTYTPGGLDLSQIRTPSMARRLARQRSLEEQEQAQNRQGGGNYQPQSNYQSQSNYHPQGGPVPPPPPPPPNVPAPPPPPPIVIEVPNSKSPKPIAPGVRPEIVIPENPIGMLRKTNSPYHWEAEKADMQNIGAVPRFQERVPSPLTVKMPPTKFSQQPQSYTPPGQNNQNYSYGNQNNHTPDSPIYKPEAQYAHQKSATPNVNGSPPMRELLQRQDSQFNKSPQPFNTSSPLNTGSPFSPSPNNNWRQPEKGDSPITLNNSPHSPHFQRGPFSPNTQQYSPNYQTQSPPTNNSGPVFHTLPRASQRHPDSFVNNSPNNNAIYNNTREPSPKVEPANATPWRTNTLNRQTREPEISQNVYHNSSTTNQQPTYTPPWKSNDSNNNENTYIPPWVQERRNSGNQINNNQAPKWAGNHDSNNNRGQESYNPPWRAQESEPKAAPVSPPNRYNQQEPPRYQSTMSIPVTPKKQNTQPEYNNKPPQKEAVYVTEEPVYFCPESPKSMPAWVKTQKEKTKTPPPTWCQRPLDGKGSIPRELATPPRDTNQEPEWVKRSNEMQRNVREVVSPPKYQQPVQPTWSTLPSENRKSVPRDNGPQSPGNSRIIPIQMEVSSTESREKGVHGNHPSLRIVIDMQQNPNSQGLSNAQAPYSQPTQRIMRVLSPQLVKLDDGPAQAELPTLNRNFQPSHDSQPKTRIIPIQIEGGNGGANKSSRVYYHKFTQEAPPRQSKAFKVLQIITGTQDDIQAIEDNHGFTDL